MDRPFVDGYQDIFPTDTDLSTACLVYVTAATLALAIWFPLGSKTGALYGFAAIFGGCIGGLISLAPVCIGQLCRVEEFGNWIGTCYFVASIA